MTEASGEAFFYVARGTMKGLGKILRSALSAKNGCSPMSLCSLDLRVRLEGVEPPTLRSEV